MPEWLTGAFQVQHVALLPLLVRLVESLIGGILVAWIHQNTRRASSVTPTFPATLVLLCVLIAVVTQVIGDNVARAFSLVGALSIVRFRTVVQDTKDTAFVIFAVVVGMSVGAEQPLVGLGGLAIVGLAAWLYRDRKTQTLAVDHQVILSIKLGWVDDVEAVIREAVAEHIADIEPLSLTTLKHGAGLEASFRVRLRPSVRLTQVVADLNRLPGVQGVELKTEQ
jgi:hypothetical protein